MKSINTVFFLTTFLLTFSCTEKELTPNEAAQQTCTCMKLSKDTSEEGVKAFADCNNKTKEMMAPFRENAEWMEEWKGELMKILKDCMTE